MDRKDLAFSESHVLPNISSHLNNNRTITANNVITVKDSSLSCLSEFQTLVFDVRLEFDLFFPSTEYTVLRCFDCTKEVSNVKTFRDV